MSDGIHPHGSLDEIADGLHCVRGRFGRSPMGRRMSIVRAPEGLLVHSPMRLREAEQARLDELGPVRWVLPPNRLHASEAPWYAERYPAARVLVPELEVASMGKRGVRVDGTLETDWPEELDGILSQHPLRGFAGGESALHHAPSRSLILNDLAMNFRGDDATGFHRRLLRFNQVYERFGPSRLLRWLILRDAAALKDSLAPILALDFDRIVVSHGSILETGGRAALREAFAFL